ncbi:MAG: DNA adenine methylase [Candidatus Dojkabacteria bacterium]|nr:MAG: DNA adenine methylase [Candidatus Dojkabacteria bacterium]
MLENLYWRNYLKRHSLEAKPFLKWAGGKRQLLNELESALPREIKEKREIDIYIEPFAGGASFFFYLKSNYSVKKAYLLDINRDLMLCYRVIQSRVSELIENLKKMEKEYLELADSEREKKYYEVRTTFNIQKEEFDYTKLDKLAIQRVSQVIFLNRTCFNGLFRENKKGSFNVPFGRYKNPKICDQDNIYSVNEALKNTILMDGDFYSTKELIEKGAVIYLDPPYKPLGKTSNFTNYSKDGFSDTDQERLAEYAKYAKSRNAFVIISNSDPQNTKITDTYFDKLYSTFKIKKVNAKRSINSKATLRGNIKELLITSY